MKTIKDLTVKATYKVGLSNVEVSDEVYNQLSQYYDEGENVYALSEVEEWLMDNIRQDDAMEWEFEIEDFE